MTDVNEGFLSGVAENIFGASLLSIKKLALFETVEQIGLVNVKTGDFHITMVSPTNPTASSSTKAPETRKSNKIREQSSHFDNLTNKSHVPKTGFLPGPPGIYLRFDDCSWWENRPGYLDIAPNLRVLPIENVKETFPSLEANGPRIDRPIVVKRADGSLHISREVDGLDMTANSPVAPDRIAMDKCGNWSIQYVYPETLMRFSFHTIYIVWEYSKLFAASMWLLVNDHPARGQEGYILAEKYGPENESQIAR